MVEKAKQDLVVVLGAGVLGLSIANRLVKEGVNVAVVARDLPEDAHSAAFASPWAGANWSSVAANEAERRRDTFTWNEFLKFSEIRPDLIKRTRGTHYFAHGTPMNSLPWFQDLCPDLRVLEESELPEGIHSGYTWMSFTLNPPAYLSYLAENLRAAGVPIYRHRVSSIIEASNLTCLNLAPSSLIINATGLGSSSLLGVQDPLVHPARGQTVLVRAPKVDFYVGIKDDTFTEGDKMYIIPRPGSGGLVILGGTYREGDFSTLPDLETAKRILKRAVKLVPDLVNDDVVGMEGKEEWEKIEIVAHNVGLRPARTGGMRLELEVGKGKEKDQDPLVPGEKNGKEKTHEYAVLHAYGIGGAGYQASLGIAEQVKDLAIKYLNEKKHNV